MGTKPFREAFVSPSVNAVELAEHIRANVNDPLPDEEKFASTSGCTPLTFALLEPTPSTHKIEALLNVGARIDMADINNACPLHICCSQCSESSPAVLALLLQHARSQRDTLMRSTVEHCLQMRDDQGHVPLQVFAASIIKRTPANAAAMARVLLSHPVDVAVRDPLGNSILHIASGHGNHCGTHALYAPFEPVLEGSLGADLCASPNGAGVTALHLAAGRANVHDVGIALRCGARADATDMKGDTALHYMAHGNCGDGDALACCQVLAAAHAPAEAENKKGDTPLLTAARDSHVAFLDPFLAVFGESIDLGRRDGAGDTAMHLYFDQGWYALSKLIAAGANVNATGRGGNTIVHLCVQRQQSTTLKEILANCTDIDLSVVNDHGKSATEECAGGRFTCHTKMMLMLMQYVPSTA